MASRDEGFEGDDLAAFLQIQKVVNKLVIELRCEGLVVDQDYIGLPKNLGDGLLVQEVSSNEMDIAGSNAPQSAACLKFSMLKVC